MLILLFGLLQEGLMINYLSRTVVLTTISNISHEHMERKQNIQSH